MNREGIEARMYILIPLMDEFLIPVPQAGFELGLALALLARLQLRKQEPKLLAERVQALPPHAAAVLAHVADKDLVEEVLDVEEHVFVVLACDHQRRRGDHGRGRRHRGETRHGIRERS